MTLAGRASPAGMRREQRLDGREGAAVLADVVDDDADPLADESAADDDLAPLEGGEPSPVGAHTVDRQLEVLACANHNPQTIPSPARTSK
jgi:hypothetical protein